MASLRSQLATELTTNRASYTKDQADRLTMLHRAAADFLAAINRFDDAAPAGVVTTLTTLTGSL